MVIDKTPKKNRPKRKKIPKIYQIIFILVIVWFLGNSIFNFILRIFVDTDLVKLSVIDEKYTTEGYIIRDEVVINSPATGKILNRIQPGERVGKDMTVFEVEASGGTALQTGESVLVKAPMAGVVSYIIDGLEEIFSPDELQSLDIKKIEKLRVEIVDNTPKNVVEKGNRYCKIVNVLQDLQIYLEFPLDIFEKPLQKNQKLELRFPELNKEISAPIVDLRGIGNTAQVLVQLPETWYNLLNVRTQPIEIIINEQEGFLIPKKALVEKENQGTGVFWLRKGFVFWQPVKILAEKGDSVLIEGLEPLTEIVINPGLVKEGQHLY